MAKFSILIRKENIIHGRYCNAHYFEILVDADSKFDAINKVVEDRVVVHWGKRVGDSITYTEPVPVLYYKEGYPRVDVARTYYESVISVEEVE